MLTLQDNWDIFPNMTTSIDETDRRILALLQSDASLGMEALAEKVHLSRNACWRRVRQMEEAGVIRGRVALVDPDALGLGLSVLVMIRTSAHRPDWLDRFETTVRAMPEIIGAYRMTGDLDYVLRVRVADVRGYDQFYKRLIARVPQHLAIGLSLGAGGNQIGQRIVEPLQFRDLVTHRLCVAHRKRLRASAIGRALIRQVEQCLGIGQ